MPTEIFILIVDSTDNGDYQNNSYAIPFRSREKAIEYMNEDIDDTLANDYEGESELTIDRLKKELVSFYDDDSAQYRRDGIIVDWRIEKNILID